MQALRSRPALRRSGLLYLRAEDIAPNPVQPRKHFDEEALLAAPAPPDKSELSFLSMLIS